eukprot:TRINITY_DN18686_c0_g2_i1.p1 TRINITY_DN18686_c0_g2~~TRINITY_DN18686_c0_g2_i1.p1  ORF type:complete len:339 (-),score=38.51 TRINITY_DN18686_c0_g2_i1:112-1128(-)
MSCGQGFHRQISHEEEAPRLCRAESPAGASASSESSDKHGQDVSALADVDLALTIRTWPANQTHNRGRRMSEGQVRKNLPDVSHTRRLSDSKIHHVGRNDAPLSAASPSRQDSEAEKQEHIRQLRLLSLQAGLQFKDVHDFGATMVGNSVGDGRRSSRIATRRSSLAASPVPEDGPPVDDPLADLLRHMGASSPYSETVVKDHGARRPSRVLLSHSAMSHYSDDKNKPDAASTSTVTPTPMASSMLTPSLRSSPSPPPTRHRGVLALLSRRPEDGCNANLQLKEAPHPGDLTWRKWRKDTAGSRSGAQTAREAGGAKASYVILSNIGLEVFNPSKLPR